MSIMEYVYKYENNDSTVVYIGITNNLMRRIKEHKKDKLSEVKNPVIYYFPVEHHGDADMLESYLIDYYKTKQYYNVSKTKKGDFSFLNICDRLPWVLYKGSIDKTIKPFVVTDVIGKPQIEKVKELVYIGYENNIDKAVREYFESNDKNITFLSLEMLNEVEFIKEIREMLKANGQPYLYNGQWRKSHVSNEFAERGLFLHIKRLRIVCLLLNEFKKAWFHQNNNKIHRLMGMMSNIREQIEDHEGHGMNNEITSFEWDKAKKYCKENNNTKFTIANLLLV